METITRINGAEEKWMRNMLGKKLMAEINKPNRFTPREIADVPHELAQFYYAKSRTIISALSRGPIGFGQQWRITSNSGVTVMWERRDSISEPWFPRPVKR